MVEEKNEDRLDLDALFEGILKPMHSKNARRVFNVFYNKKQFEHLTTHDLEILLEHEGLSISKKEINAWLVSLQDAGLIMKMDERGKPVVSAYEDKDTFDLWRLSETGLNVGHRLPILMAKEEKSDLPRLAELSPKKIHELEDLYYTSKILLLLHDHDGSLSYSVLRRQLALDREMLAVYSWPDASHSEMPLFEIKVKPPTIRSRIFMLFGWVQEQDLIFTLTETGKKMVETIFSKENEP